MKRCQICGEELRETNRVCPHCGSAQPEQAMHYTQAEYEIEESEEPSASIPTPKTVEPETPTAPIPTPKAEEPPAAPKKRISGLSIAALICALSIVLAPLGVLFAIIDLAKSKGRQTKRGMSTAALTVGGMIVLIGIVGMVGANLPMANSRKIVAIDCGHDVIAGLRQDGTVAVSVNPQYLDPAVTSDISGWTDIVQIETDVIDSYLLGIKKDGTVVVSLLAAGDQYEDTLGQQLQSWTDIVEIVGAGNFVYGVKKDGTVEVAVLRSDLLTDRIEIIRSWKDIRKLTVLGQSVYGWKSDGTIECAPMEGPDVLSPYGSSVADLGGLSQAEAAQLKNGDMVYLWKDQPEYSGIRFDFPQWHDLKKIIVHNRNAVGLKKDGTVVSVYAPDGKKYNPYLDTMITVYGGNAFGQCDVGDWSEIIDICGTDISTFGLKKDGTVVHAGDTDWFDPAAWD